MNDFSPYRTPEGPEREVGGSRGRRRGWVVAGVTTAALVVAGTVVVEGSLLSGGHDRAAERETDTRWAEGITPEWMGERMGLDVPATARSAQAAYEVTSRFDTGLLTFTLTRSEAEAYLEKHPPSGRWLTPTAAQSDTPPSDFSHFGLPEPETFKNGMRYGDVCPGTVDEPAGTPGALATDPYDTSDENCTSLYAHDYAPKRTRIYLRTHFEPGISPLPATSSAPSPAG
ncbi:hypothetical protein [Streptomyces sp. SID2888]|uniref:hypothetical protein n=1 Tax=Streptomyces sp. SID2888 TaxID=2690256 RepID=UPI0013700603|nr:hypothetical protein [Streptomyces sp. SID2888]